MKIFILLLFISLSSFSQEKLSIIAVGEAEQDKDVLSFSEIENISSAPSEIKSKLLLVRQIVLKDFSFYRFKFEIKEDNSPKESYDFSIKFKYLNGLTIDLFDVKNKNVILSKSYGTSFNTQDIRRFSHSLANDLYRGMTGKNSIFNSKIVFVTDVHSTKTLLSKELYIMDFDGERKERLTFNNSVIISPSLSPDNSKIVYSLMELQQSVSSRGRSQKVKNINLYMMDLMTRKQTLVSNKLGINSGAIFDHSGENIYLTLTTSGNADIYKMNLSTQNLTKVTSHYSDDVDPSINEDGSLMTFLSGRSGRAMIYTMDPRSVEKDVKRVSYVGQFNAAPRFSKDGKEIVFSSWVDNCFDVYKIGSNGQNLVRLTKNFGSNEEASFSPDGEFIVFTSQKVISSKMAIQNVYIMNREGEIVAQVTDNFGKITSPRWSN